MDRILPNRTVGSLLLVASDSPETHAVISGMPRVRIPRGVRRLVAAALGFEIQGVAVTG